MDIPVFLHIFKCSGSSVIHQLMENFGASNVRVANGKDAMGDDVLSGLNAGRVHALAGHFTYAMVSPVFDSIVAARPRYFSFVRDPLNRLASAYSYARSTPMSKWHAMAISLEMDDFFIRVLDIHPGFAVNHQCWSLAEDGKRDFETAKATIEKKFSFIGISEDLTLQNAMAKKFLGFEFSGSVRKNASPSGRTGEDFGSKTREILKQKTQEDRKLHDWVWNRCESVGVSG